MKKIMLIGSTGCGKTTLCNRLNDITEQYKKTQALEVVNSTIDTPGEYLDKRNYLNALIVTSVEVDVILMLQDASDTRFSYSPGQSSAFAPPCIGIVTKIDIATPQQIREAAELLKLAGAIKVFCLSSRTGENIEELMTYLE
jgi:ethanolamine utilization protein EutP